MINTFFIKKKLDKSENYLYKLDIETFDGSGGTTHPYVFFFEEEFNGYKYWMVHTPYDNNNTELENPSLLVSNDGINFHTPKGLKNPLLPVLKKEKNKPTKYYSDPFILLNNNSLEIWYRYTIDNKKNKSESLNNKIFRIVSNDGINWSKPELMLENDGIWYLSPSIIKIKNIYYLYYYDKDLKLYCTTSNDLKIWNKPVLVYINGYFGNFWHGEVKNIHNKLYLLFLSNDNKLFFCESDVDTPFCFENCTELKFCYFDKKSIYGNLIRYKSSFLIKDHYIDLYVPFRINAINWHNLKCGLIHKKWTLTYTHLKLDNFYEYVMIIR